MTMTTPATASDARATSERKSAGTSQVPAAVVETLVRENLALVGHIVRETMTRLPAHIGRDDLTSAGMAALVLSAQGYDESRGVPFARFAAIRIRGALVDELRSMDWASRSVRGRAREVDAARNQLSVTLGRSPRPHEVAETLGVSVSELGNIDADVHRASVLSLQGFAPETGPELMADATAGPEALLLFREKLGYLHQAIEALPERLRFVVVAYFFEQRQMADIGAELGVTESRVSQLRAEALRALRDGMNSQLEPTVVEQPSGKGRASASRRSYLCAVAEGGTMSSRLAATTAIGEVRPEARPAARAMGHSAARTSPAARATKCDRSRIA